MGLLIQRAPVVAGALGEVLGVRLVAQTPQHDAGVVPVALDHRLQHGAVVGLEREGLVRVARRACTDADGGRLIDDDDAQTVTQVVDLLGVGVMAHPQAVGVQPLVQLQIGHRHAGVIAATTEGRVLMLAGALEIERCAVNKELMSADLHAAEAELLAVLVLAELNQRRVEIRRAGAGLPQAGVLHLHGARGTVGAGHNAALGVQNLHLDAALAHGVHRVAQHAGHVGGDSHIADVGRRGRVEVHRAGDAGIVEEVKVRQVDALGLLARLAGLDGGNARVVGAKERRAALVADGQRAVADAVVHLDVERHGLAGLGQRGDVGLKRQEAAAVAGDLLPVQPHHGVVGHSVKAQHPARALGHGKGRAVVRHTVVAAKLRVGALVIVGRRHRDGLPRLVGVKTEIPHAGQIPDAAGGIGLRIHIHYLSIQKIDQPAAARL